MVQAGRPPAWRPPNPSLAGTSRPAPPPTTPAARRPDTRAAQVIGSSPTTREGAAFPPKSSWRSRLLSLLWGFCWGLGAKWVFLRCFRGFLCSERVLWRLL